MTPRSEAIAFRAWQVASRMEWDCTVAEIADEIGADPKSLGAIFQAKGWVSRVRVSDHHRARATLSALNLGQISHLAVEARAGERVAVNDILRQGVLAGGSL